MTKKLHSAPTWDTRVKLALDYYEGKISDKKALGEGLFTLKTHLENILKFQPTEELVTGQIHLIRPSGSSKYDNCGLVSVSVFVFFVFILIVCLFFSQYCKQTPQITLVNGDHLGIISSPETTEYINEKHYLI